MTDRRRINPPPSGTSPLIFSRSAALSRPQRLRKPNQPRKLFLRTGLTPSASGSAYLELEQPAPSTRTATSSGSLNAPPSTLKLSCTVHGPKPLPRSAPFSPQLLLFTHVKFAPYASRHVRRGPVRDAVERDLGAHLEAALRGVVIGDRWPKSGVDVSITVLEEEEDSWWAEDDGFEEDENTLKTSSNSAGSSSRSARSRARRGGGIGGAGMLSVLAGCITVASAAIVEAGIDCVDTVAGGVAAIVRRQSTPSEHDSQPTIADKNGNNELQIVVDPCPSEHDAIIAACTIGYLPSRDEVTEMWLKGDAGFTVHPLVDAAVRSAGAMHTVLSEVLKESMQASSASSESSAEHQSQSDDGNAVEKIQQRQDLRNKLGRPGENYSVDAIMTG